MPKGVAHPDALAHSSAAGTILITGFWGREAATVTSEAYPALRAALQAESIVALYDAAPLWAPCYCPECGVSYCHAHWRIGSEFEEDGWYDCSHGECPKGHRRLIDD